MPRERLYVYSFRFDLILRYEVVRDFFQDKNKVKFLKRNVKCRVTRQLVHVWSSPALNVRTISIFYTINGYWRCKPHLSDSSCQDSGQMWLATPNCIIEMISTYIIMRIEPSVVSAVAAGHCRQCRNVARIPTQIHCNNSFYINLRWILLFI